MNLSEILNRDTILYPLLSKDRESVIQDLLSHLQDLDYLSATTTLFSNIGEEEKNVCSAAGRGVAFPHSTSVEVKELVAVLGISKHGIDYNSPDGQLCHLILLTLSPVDEQDVHRRFINRFQHMLRDSSLRAELFDVSSPLEAENIILHWEDEQQREMED
jgi:PTS system nitrogen regulatory IIA component